MGLTPPPQVQQNPGQEVVVFDAWQVPFRPGGRDLAVPATLGQTVAAAIMSLLWIAIGIFGARQAWQADEASAAAFVFSCATLAVGSGLLHQVPLTASQIASLLPVWVARAVTAANGALLVAAAAAFIVHREVFAAAKPTSATTKAAGSP
jgi:hypothetical protein